MGDKTYNIAVIGGDGVGPEVTEAALAVLDAAGAKLAVSSYRAGDQCLADTGAALPDETLQGALAADAVLFGAAGSTAADVILRLRAEMGTYVNLRPTKALKGVACLHPETDLMIVRENTEDLYVGREEEVAPGEVHALRVITRKASERIAKCAFDYARDNGRKKVTAIHKSNVLIKSDGLFLECCRKVAKDYPDITYDEGIVDAASMFLVMNPSKYDVMVTTNMFGDILSDLASGLIGGLGLSPSANLGDEHALFEPVHGSAPDIAGKGLANPAAAIMCGAMMMKHLGEAEMGDAIQGAVEAAIAAGETTQDLGGKLSTMDMARAVAARL